MHYYQFNIGDYSSHTNHLDPIEDIAYRRMLDWCYTHEVCLPNDVQEIARYIRMRDYAAVVRDILNEFFEQTDEGWFSARVQIEIEAYRTKKEKAIKAGKASAERRLNGRSTDVQPTINQEPITKNQETKKKQAVSAPEGVSESVWKDFVAMRKAQRAEITNTALEGLIREAGKAKMTLEQVLRVCCERGWRGFKADWMAGQAVRVNPQDVARTTTPTPDNAFDALRKIEADRKKAAPIPTNIREKINGMLKMPDGKNESVGNV